MESLYIHIPFCDQICNYCDFPKRVAKSELKEKYFDYLKQEYLLYDIPALKTIYIGGGTPSSISLSLIEKLLQMLPEVEELTFECNPNDINVSLLNMLKKNNVTRISLGVQTFNNDILQLIGRTHNQDEALQAIKLIQSYEFDLSIDMIFNLPKQNVQDLLFDIEKIMENNIEHVSYYSLILEPKTVFDYWISKGIIEEPENGDYFYEVVIQKLEENGYTQYEISNFTKGHMSKHNMTYWNNNEYIGLGLASSGYINGERYSNVKMFSEYFDLLDLGKKPVLNINELSKKDIMYEHLMLGFRKLEGISIQEFNERYSIDVFKAFPELEKLVSEEYLTVINDKIKVTKKGLFYNNDMLVRLL